MKKVLAALAVATVLMFSGSALHAEEMLNGAGATFPYPVYSAWANEYNKITGMKLNYQSIGSGGGIKQITERTVDFGASDKPLTPEELAKDNLLQFPAVIGGVVPVINIPGIKAGELRLDADAVCKIYMGEIKNWNDPKIKGMNPKLNLPASEITVVHRSDGSGTTAIFYGLPERRVSGLEGKGRRRHLRKLAGRHRRQGERGRGQLRAAAEKLDRVRGIRLCQAEQPQPYGP